MRYTIEDRDNGYKWVRIYEGENMAKMAKWCQDTGCGKMVNFYTISFRQEQEQELTAFLLRWQGQE